MELRILLSAYACEPNRGSEPGIGWHWALALVSAGHSVTVLTRSNNRESIEAFRLHRSDVSLPDFIYFDLSPTLISLKRRGILPVSLYYIIWQWVAAAQIQRIASATPFDFFWHLTFGVIRNPSFVPNIGIPIILGPLGGGERAPWPMRRDYDLRGHLVDLARDILNQIARFDPFARRLFQRATLVFAKTRQTAALVPPRHSLKTSVQLEIGIPDVAQPRHNIGTPLPRLLFAGRFIYWKGVTLAIRAFAEYVQQGGRGRLTMLGRGPESVRATRLAVELGVAELIDWIGWVEQSDIQKIYDRHDLLLFPSLHDSSGNVVLEALARGLPVACFNLGGPAEIATPATGIVLEISGLNAHEAARKLGERLYTFFARPETAEIASQAAIERARQFLWPTRLVTIMAEIETALRRRKGAAN